MLQNEVKSARLLAIYSELVSGQLLQKKELAQRFHVTERSIQRDMESLRCFLRTRDFSKILFTTAQPKVTCWKLRGCRC